MKCVCSTVFFIQRSFIFSESDNCKFLIHQSTKSKHRIYSVSPKAIQCIIFFCSTNMRLFGKESCHYFFVVVDGLQARLATVGRHNKGTNSPLTCAITETPPSPTGGGGSGGVAIICGNFEFRGYCCRLSFLSVKGASSKTIKTGLSCRQDSLKFFYMHGEANFTIFSCIRY